MVGMSFMQVFIVRKLCVVFLASHSKLFPAHSPL